MLFNSFSFIFIFLPIVFIVYWMLNYYRKTKLSIAFLVLASLIFYSYWDIIYLPLILFSMIVNYCVGSKISRLSHIYMGGGSLSVKLQDNLESKSILDYKNISPKFYLIFGISFNLALLGYFKYTDFFITNFNGIFTSEIPLFHIVLPIGISFFTFTQIAFLVDAFRGKAKEYNLLNYALFITYFPHLLAGPILHHSEMMPQFASLRNKFLNYKNIVLGLFIFSIGLFKKVVIADTFSVWANAGFDNSASLNLAEAWITSLSYTFQLYFDFSGYTDMALGISLLFNIKLPFNFNSPYKSLSIQDFWRRWHMTLSRFLRDYLYILLGGSRKGHMRTYLNLLITFLLGGLWHGAGWTFILWGAIHGIGLVIHRIWSDMGLRMPKILAWAITFNFINIAWVFFRAESIQDAINILKAMIGINGIVLPRFLENYMIWLGIHDIEFGGLLSKIYGDLYTIIFVFVGFLICLLFKNSTQIQENFKSNSISAIYAAILLIAAIFNFSKASEFLYFNF